MIEEVVGVFSFTMAMASDKRNVATLSYELEREGEGGAMLLKLQGLRFLGTSSAEYKRVVLTHVPPQLWYKSGVDVEKLFPGWRAHGYVAKDITSFDVSFEKFWQVYGKKVGNKSGVEKKWGKLSWEEKVLAIGCVGRMRRYYESKGIELPYPETYINQRRWENEFEG